MAKQQPSIDLKSITVLVLVTAVVALGAAAEGINAPPDPPTAIEFVPVAPRAGADLSAVIVSGADIDGDPVTTTCTWRVNGRPRKAGYILPRDRFAAGDVVTLEARFWDGTHLSAPTSRSVEIAGATASISRDDLALRFDGRFDHVFIPGFASLDLRDSMTLSAWVKSDGDDDGAIIWRGDTRGGQDPYSLRVTRQRLEFRLDRAAGKAHEYTIQSRQPLDGEWHFWSGAFDSAAQEMRLYRNGELEAATSMTEPLRFDTTGMWNVLGAVDNGDWQHFAGALDEVRVWSRARPATEIRADMHRRLSGKETGLVAYWRCDEGGGQFLVDASAFENHGVLGGIDETGDDDPAWTPRAGDPRVHYLAANGHHYEKIKVARGITWEAAYDQAERRYYLGRQGYLATLAKREESDFVTARLIDFPERGMHLGGWQPDGSPEPDGGWRWITGEPWAFTNWSPDEPNNRGSGPEGFLTVAYDSKWNDIPANHPEYHYLVEYDTTGPWPDRVRRRALRLLRHTAIVPFFWLAPVEPPKPSIVALALAIFSERR